MILDEIHVFLIKHVLVKNDARGDWADLKKFSENHRNYKFKRRLILCDIFR